MVDNDIVNRNNIIEYHFPSNLSNMEKSFRVSLSSNIKPFLNLMTYTKHDRVDGHSANSGFLVQGIVSQWYTLFFIF